MRAYKIWFYFAFALLAAIASVMSLSLLGYWFAQAYRGNSQFLAQKGAFLLVTYGILAFVQVVLYASALLIALSVPRIHRFSRRIFRWWLGGAFGTLILMLLLMPDHTFWEALPLFYPVLSVLTSFCALLSLWRSAGRLGRRSG
jgi:hypothetical protein